MTELKLKKSIIERIERINSRTKKRNFMKEEFEIWELSKLDGSLSLPFIRFDGRIYRNFYNIPLNIVHKAIRGSDSSWDDATIENWVMVNHNADLLFKPQHKEVIDNIIDENKTDNLSGYIDIYYGKTGRKRSRKYDIGYMGIDNTYKGFITED
jgi:hypothetical protein